MVGATGFESETAGLRFSQLQHHQAVLVRDSPRLPGGTCERFGRSCEAFTVRKCQGDLPKTTLHLQCSDSDASPIYCRFGT
jgi:hypothetical protein